METITNKITEVLPAEYHTKLRLNRANIFDPDSWLSKSALYELYGSSLYKWRYHPRNYTSTPAMTWGSMVDCLITCDDEQFDNEFVISPYDSMRSKAAREWKVEQELLGKIIITGEQQDEAKLAVKTLTQTHKVAAAIIEKSKKQVLLKQRIDLKYEGAGKIGLKGLVDLAPEGEDYLADLKTTRDFSASGFSKTIAKFGYHAQAAHYLAMWNLQNPNDQRHRFRIIWQDSADPYEVAVTEMPEIDIAAGSDLINHMIMKLVVATIKNKWHMKFEKPILLGRASFGVYADEEEMDDPTLAPD